jgi:GWxTD domain-containing protein
MRAKLLAFLLIFWVFPTWAIQALISSSVFQTLDYQNYVEIQMLIQTNSLKFKPQKSKLFEGGVQCHIILKKGNFIFKNDVFNIKSTAADSLHHVEPELIHFEKYLVESGQYECQLVMTDINDSSNKSSTRFYFESSIPKSEIVFSQPFFYKNAQNQLPSVLRQGKYIVPYPNDFFYKELDTIRVYAELYHTNPILMDSTLLLRYFIKDIVRNEELLEYGGMSKIKTSNIIPIFLNIPVTTLPPGTYEVVIEARNKQFQFLESASIAFKRTLPILVQKKEVDQGKLPDFVNKMSISEVRNNIRNILPIMNQTDRNLALPLTDLKYNDTFRLKPYFAQYWIERNPSDPYLGWIEYEKKLDEVNRLFSCPKQNGIDTDRGRVYLQYGPPNQRTERKSDPVALPYEIWWYYTLEDQQNLGTVRQRNAKFLFCNKEVSNCDYQLIHSTAMGELNNPQWKNEIFRRNLNGNSSGNDNESIRLIENTLNNN